MGQKVNPISLRLGINRGWDSVWFDEKKFSDRINEDILIRRYIENRFNRASLSKIIINRKPSKTLVTISTARPGLVIGKGGSEVELVKKALKQNIHVVTGNKAMLAMYGQELFNIEFVNKVILYIY